ncbi:MAG: winged helix-turn-helix domain-containing protein [Blastocatellia bacterium]
MSNSGKHFYDFDRFRIDATERVLLADGEIIPLTQKAFDVLMALVERRGQIVSKDELMELVWPDTFVEEGNLAQNIYTLRKVLGQTSDEQDFIKTIPKRGYRFVSSVNEHRDLEPELMAEPAAAFSQTEKTAPKHSVVIQFPADRSAVRQPESESWIRSIGRHKTLVATLAVLLIASVGSLIWLGNSSGWNLFSAGSSAKPTLTNLTTTGNVACSSVSPDGKFVAYAVIETAQRSSLWLMQLATLNAQQIIAPSEIQYHALTFTPDGQFINYVARENNSPRTLFQVSVIGGASKKLLENVHTAISFSPDGAQFAFRRSIDERRAAVMFIANSDGSGEKELASIKYPEGFGDPAWSPDGKMIASAAGHAEGSANMYVVAVRASDGAIKPLSSQRFRWIGQLEWLPDSSALMMVASQDPARMRQVWRLDYATGEVRRVTNDSNSYNRLSLSADGKTMVVSQLKQVTNMWMIPRQEPQRAEQITFGAGGYRGKISWTPGGRIVYDSEGGNASTISVMNADGSNQKLLMGAQPNKVYAGRAEVSPDGRFVVFASETGGTRHVWRMNMDGGSPMRLTNGDGEDSPHCSPDGRWVVYTKLERKGVDRPTIWRVSIDGGEPKQLTDEFTAYPAISPDGKWIACSRSAPNEPGRIAIYPFEGGKPIRIFPQPVDGTPLIRWTPDGQFLTYDENPIGPAKLWLQPVEGGAPKLLTEFASDRIFGFDWSPDGKRLAIVRGLWSANVVLLKDFR